MKQFIQFDKDSSIWTVHLRKKYELLNKLLTIFLLFENQKWISTKMTALFQILAHRYCRKPKWYLNFTLIGSFCRNIINWFLSFTQILSHWDRINTIDFRIVCRFRICNLYSYTSSLSKSYNLTATLLCSATLQNRGFLRHISQLIQLINYIHLGCMPELFSFL